MTNNIFLQRYYCSLTRSKQLFIQFLALKTDFIAAYGIYGFVFV